MSTGTVCLTEGSGAVGNFGGVGKCYLSYISSEVLRSEVPGSPCLLLQIRAGWGLGYVHVLLDL